MSNQIDKMFLLYTIKLINLFLYKNKKLEGYKHFTYQWIYCDQNS